MKATHILQMLADGSADLADDAYDSMEAETRSVLIAMFVKPECALVFSGAAAEHNYAVEDRFLYLGSHLCRDRKIDDGDDAYIELWAWIDPSDGEDFVTWNLTTTDSEIKYPIDYCPFCGMDLRAATLNQIALSESTGSTD